MASSWAHVGARAFACVSSSPPTGANFGEPYTSGLPRLAQNGGDGEEQKGEEEAGGARIMQEGQEAGRGLLASRTTTNPS
eukprot:5541329-Pyramimonas_sp.AAC.1